MAKTAVGTSLAVKQANAILTTSKSLARAKHAGRPRKKHFTIPLAVVGGFLPFASWTYGTIRADGHWNGFSTWAKYAPKRFIPINESGKFDASKLSVGILPILLGFAVHRWVGGKMGVNRMMARAGIPLIRL
jgi:hypothetical protein